MLGYRDVAAYKGEKSCCRIFQEKVSEAPLTITSDSEYVPSSFYWTAAVMGRIWVKMVSVSDCTQKCVYEAKKKTDHYYHVSNAEHHSRSSVIKVDGSYNTYNRNE